jgi:FkbH-like protein
MNCPSFLLNGECDDNATDRLGQMPFTQAAFDQLGEYLATEIKRTLRQSDTATVTKTADSTQFAAYLAGLNVQVKLARAEGSNCAHVGRMLRTIAGFCLTGQKPHLTDEEVARMTEGRDCFLVSVSDRLAEYGTTGFVLCREANQQMTVEEMALSCIVLGKQAEFAVLSALGRYADSRGLKRIPFKFAPSDRNQPTQEFLESVAVNEPGVGYVVNVADVEGQIKRAAVKPGAWRVSLEDSRLRS